MQSFQTATNQISHNNQLGRVFQFSTVAKHSPKNTCPETYSQNSSSTQRPGNNAHLTSGQDDGIRLLITTVHNVATLGHTLLGGAWQVGDPLPGQRQDGGAAIALLVDSPVVLYCHLHPNIAHV